MATQRKLSIIPIYLGPKLGRINYWWSTRQSAPYLLGRKHMDWGGPFDRFTSASKAAEEIWRVAHPAANHVEIRFDLKEVVEVSGPLASEDVKLHLLIPRDDYSDRIYHSGANSQEKLDLANELKLDVDVSYYNKRSDSDFLVINTTLDTSAIKPDFVNDSVVAFFLKVKTQSIGVRGRKPWSELVASVPGIYEKDELSCWLA